MSDALPGYDARISYSALPGARWTDVAFEEGTQRYDIDAMTEGSIDFEDLTGGDPLRFAVHAGDLHVTGPSYISNDKPGTVYVIEGDLTVDGSLALADSGCYVPLWVRGNLVVPRLATLRDAHLFVEGDLRVEGELAMYLDDAAHVIALGAATLGSWVCFSKRGEVYLGELEPMLVTENDERLAAEVAEIPNKPLAIGETVFAGRSVLR